TSVVDLVNSRDLELTNLGSDEARKIGYIKEPLESAYDKAATALVQAKRGRGGSGVFVFGPANAGKTRMAYELMRDVLDDWKVLRWNALLSPENLPSRAVLSDQNIVIFIDDLQLYGAGETGAIGSIDRTEGDMRNLSHTGKL